MITLTLSRGDAMLVLKGLKRARQKAQQNYDPTYVPPEGKYDANLSVLQRVDVLTENIKTQLSAKPIEENSMPAQWPINPVKSKALLEAAPDLLEALQRCWEYLDCIPESAAGGDDEARALAKMAKARIKQATGE